MMILDCYKILKKIEPRPAMYVGENSLKAINMYISGYYQALLDEGTVTSPQTEDPFFDWVANKLGYYESTAGWANMILADVMGYDTKNINWDDVLIANKTDEHHTMSINRFYELLEEFKLKINRV